MLPNDERGSLMLLHIFLTVACVTAVTVIADVGRVIGVRQSLAATADQAAVAGAQAIDLSAYYAQGAEDIGVIALDPHNVEAAVRRYLAPAIAAQQQEDLHVIDVEVADGEVMVSLQCRARLPFASLFGIESVPVRAAANASLLIQS